MILIIALVSIGLALFGAPLFAVLAAVALLSFYSIGSPTTAVVLEMYRIASEPVLLAIPLFTLAGYVMAESGAPRRLVALSRVLLGWLPGGLSLVVLTSCAVFTAFTGATGVTIIALGGLLFPALIEDGYPDRFSLGLVTATGSLGLLFPPSLPIILYGLVAGVMVDKLFLAGIIPGMLMVVLLALYCLRQGVKLTGPRSPFELGKLLKALRDAAWEVPLPLLVIGGIYGGIFTVTELAAVTAVYVLVVEVVIYRDIGIRRDLPRILKESMILVGGILIILGAALGLTSFLVEEEIPMRALEFIQTFIHSPLLFLVCLNVGLLVVGCLMDIFSAIIVVVPLITPIAAEFGIDPVHLGIIFLANLGIGYSTPPVGLNLFIASFRFKRPVVELYRAALPFLIILLLALAVITYVPFLSLALL